MTVDRFQGVWAASRIEGGETNARRGQTVGPSPSIALFLADTSIGLATFAGGTKAHVHQTSEPESTAPFDRLRRSIVEYQIFVELVARNERRNAALLKYRVLNTD
jgi:hypothetical protein